MKVTVVGAGNVGATCADVLATREIANEAKDQLEVRRKTAAATASSVAVIAMRTCVSSP